MGLRAWSEYVCRRRGDRVAPDRSLTGISVRPRPGATDRVDVPNVPPQRRVPAEAHLSCCGTTRKSGNKSGLRSVIVTVWILPQRPSGWPRATVPTRHRRCSSLPTALVWSGPRRCARGVPWRPSASSTRLPTESTTASGVAPPSGSAGASSGRGPRPRGKLPPGRKPWRVRSRHRPLLVAETSRSPAPEQFP